MKFIVIKFLSWIIWIYLFVFWGNMIIIRVKVLIRLGIDKNLIIFILSSFFKVIKVNKNVKSINIKLFLSKMGKNINKVIIVVNVFIFIFYFLFNFLKCFWCDWYIFKYFFNFFLLKFGYSFLLKINLLYEVCYIKKLFIFCFFEVCINKFGFG